MELDYDRAGRPIEVGTDTDSDAYLAAAAYAPHGAASSMTLGNGLVETIQYNARLQPTQIQAERLMTLIFDYGLSTANNGNIVGQTIWRGSFNVTQSYQYDGVNRLDLAQEGSTWTRDYRYDDSGNRWISGDSVSFNTATNRLTGGSYDNAGNLLAYTNVAQAMVYDANNKMTEFTGPVGGMNEQGEYAYDGQGNRVGRTSTIGSTSTTTTYVYDAFGMLAAEYSSEAPTGDAETFFRSTDHLGSTRLVTDASGAACEARDFYPFGGRIPSNEGGRSAVPEYAEACGFAQQFTAKERDTESGLDYFLARYYGSSLGRFTSVDPGNAGATVVNPQTWNGYAYVNNNPTAFVDPNGESATFFGALGGGIIGGAVAAYRGEDISTGVLKGAVASALAGSVIDTGGASLAVIAASGAVGGGSAVALDQTFAEQDVTLGGVATGAAVGAVAGPIVGKAGGAVVGAVRQASARGAAQGATEAVAAASSSKTATVVGAFDTKTGAIAVGRSGVNLNPVNPQVAARAQRVGGIGARNPGARGAVGNCAECDAANQLGNQGSNLNNVRFTDALRPRRPEVVVPKCDDCEVMFPNQ